MAECRHLTARVSRQALERSWGAQSGPMAAASSVEIRGTHFCTLRTAASRGGSRELQIENKIAAERAFGSASHRWPRHPIPVPPRDSLMNSFHLMIGGKPVTAPSTFNVIDPADESVVAPCPEATIAIVDSAVASARQAFPAWSALPDADRVTKLNAIAALIEQHHPELSELVTREQGKTQSGPGANLEIGGAVGWTRATASLQLPEETIQDDEAGRILVTRKPVGVVASITPWNWPLLIAVWHIMPALRVGCTVVVKPSPFTPLSTLRLVELMSRVLPPGVINVVTGGPEIGTHLSNHPNVAKLVFTGSIPTGRKVMESAARTLKRLTLELGGNDAGIILPGTNIEPLLEKLFWGCFINAGQTCAALKRLYVPRGPIRRRSCRASPNTAPRFRWAKDWIRRISSGLFPTVCSSIRSVLTWTKRCNAPTHSRWDSAARYGEMILRKPRDWHGGSSAAPPGSTSTGCRTLWRLSVASDAPASGWNSVWTDRRSTPPFRCST